MTQFGKRLIKGMREAVAVAKGEIAPARVFTDVDVAKIRAKLKLSQSEFAALLDVSKRVVQDREQSPRRPSPPLKVGTRAVRRALTLLTRGEQRRSALRKH